MNQTPKQPNLTSLLGVGAFVALLLGGVYAFPLVIGVAVYLAVRRSRQQAEGQDAENGGPSLRRQLSEQLEQLRSGQEEPPMGRARSQVQTRYRPPTADGTFSSVPDEMLSESERYHMVTMGSGSHDDLAHRAEELKDLLSAGIIDKPEYNDRMHQLTKEHRGTRG